MDIGKSKPRDLKLKISFINPNSKEDFEELLKLVIIEKVKRKTSINGSLPSNRIY